MIKIKPHFSDAHFDDRFITFGLASSIMVSDPIFRMALFYEISDWNHISDYHTVSNPLKFVPKGPVDNNPAFV